MLYDDADQLEVRHVVSLAHYHIDLYAGGEMIPEGELFIKRNCIRLTQQDSTDSLANSKPFYLFSESCSEKEDFYHAMLQSQQCSAGMSHNVPRPLKFDTSDLVRLVQQLHASEENLHTRWINALVGRLFLAMYKTEDVERFIWTKITKKIARVPKPALIDGIHVRSIEMGDLPPFITNPRLRDFSVDGDLTIEADISYKGNFRLEISAIARIELGSRFKAREVTLVLATILKRLDGHILLRIKAPPSNRLWVTFETPPKMDLSIEPIVSSRQITYGVIIRAIESRIREVVSETLVLPNWDDIPFSSTSSRSLRGGVWEDQGMKENFLHVGVGSAVRKSSDDVAATKLDGERPHTSSATFRNDGQSSSAISRQNSQDFGKANGVTAATEEVVGISSAVNQWCHAKPKNMRSGSFASAASPLVNAKPAISKFHEHRKVQNVASIMRTTISRSPPSSPTLNVHSTTDPISDSDRTNEKTPEQCPKDNLGSEASASGRDSIVLSQSLPFSAVRNSMRPDRGIAQDPPKDDAEPLDERSSLNNSLSSATTAAKKWINSRQMANPIFTGRSESQTQVYQSRINTKFSSSIGQNDLPTEIQSTGVASMYATKGDPQIAPIGRGQPLPPPGTPLPPPPKSGRRNTWVPSTLATLTRRRVAAAKEPTSASSKSPIGDRVPAAKHTQNVDLVGVDRSVPAPQAAAYDISSTDPLTTSTPSDHDHTPPPLPKRRPRASFPDQPSSHVPNEILIVAAPSQEGSTPTTPNELGEHDYGDGAFLGQPESQDVMLRGTNQREEEP
jgi:hypothetical protein